MKKLSSFLLISLLMLSCQNQAQNQENTTQKKDNKTTTMEKQTIYQFKVTDLYGNEFDFPDDAHLSVSGEENR